MEAEDYIREKCHEVYGFWPDTDRGEGWMDGAKWGIKEVVEWIRKANNSGNFYYSFDQVSLEAKLKEWGVDETHNTKKNQ